MPHPGQMLGDRYRLDDRIAAGGMGEVWQATDTVLGRDVAVKTLHAGQAADPGFQTRFRHEARAMAVLHHPGVADVYDYGQTADGSDAYIVMARVRGQPLNQWIAERGRLTAAETMSIVAQAARALDAAHQAGIVHRDVKPSNLIVQPDGRVVLVDFGVARSAESAALTGAKEVVGTALYIAPEQVSKQTTGPPADVYALGAVAYHCLTGHPPFLGPNPLAVAMQHLHDDAPELPPEVPEPVRALVATALAKDPAHRFPSAAAMADAADAARRLLPGGSDGGSTLDPIGSNATGPRSIGSPATGPDSSPLDSTRLDSPAAPATGSEVHGPGRPSGAWAVGAAAVPAFGSGGGPPTGSQTASLAGLPTDPPGLGNRRRLLIALATVLVALATAAAVLALVNPAAFFPGSPGASPSAPTSPVPSAKNRSAAPAATATGRSTRTATTGPAASPTSRSAGASPTPSPRPSATSTTGAPPTTAAPTAVASTAAAANPTTAGVAR